MPLPNVSQRLHYRLPPAPPTEPTSTIVLTSKDAHYIDIRLSLSALSTQADRAIKSASCIDWAFAGKSRTTKHPTEDNRSHTVWEHWIDSNGDDAPADEGDMTVLEDGTVLEEGWNVKEGGEKEKYEELWKDLPIEAAGRKGNKQCVVLKAEGEGGKGLVVKIGGWCQGILRGKGGLTVERWESKPKVEGEAKGGVEEETRTRNDWVRTFKAGKGVLPCGDVCAHTDGKLGLNHKKVYGEGDYADYKDGLEWKVVEEYYW